MFDFTVAIFATILIFILIWCDNRIDRPFKCIVLYMLFFVALRYFYIKWGMSSFEDIDLSRMVYPYYFVFITCGFFALSAYYIEHKFPGINTSKVLLSDVNNDLFFWVIALIGLMSIISVLIYRQIVFGSFYVDVSIDPWQGIYSLKIPALCALMSMLYSIGKRNAILFAISIVPVIVLIVGEHERSPIFNLTLSLLLFFYLLKRLNRRVVLLLLVLSPFVFEFLTIRRFGDLHDNSLFNTLIYAIEQFDFEAILKDSYGRYYGLESTYMLLVDTDLDRTRNVSLTYLQSRFSLPFIDSVDHFSLSQYICEAIKEGRWRDGVSCWAYLPAFTLYDSGLYGLFLSIPFVIFCIYMWSIISVSSSPVVLISYIFLFPKLIVFLNYSIASFMELVYYFIYIAIVFNMTKFLASKLNVRAYNNAKS